MTAVKDEGPDLPAKEAPIGELRRNESVYWAEDGELVLLYNPKTGDVRRLRGSLARFWVSRDMRPSDVSDPSLVQRLIDEGWLVEG